MRELKNVGILFGCFIPMHEGHMKLLTKSRMENEKTILCVTGYDMDRGRDFIPFLRRIKLIEQAYGNGPDIILSHVNDRKIGLTGTFSLDAWRTWSKEMFLNAKMDPCDKTVRYHWYTGDTSYIEKLHVLYPSHVFHLVSRDEIPLSGTVIREDPHKYKDSIHPLFWDYLTKNVL